MQPFNRQISPFCCPNCQGRLFYTEQGLLCENGHSFDRAKSGYYNLLLPQKGKNGFHGDNPLMVKARRAFLEKGYYTPLAEALQETVLRHLPKGGLLLDCGCGEGYYTNAVAKVLEGETNFVGIDISKTAVDKAARRCKSVQFAVASAFHLPLRSQSVSMLLQIFSPHCTAEFSRVLKKGGIFLEVFPGPMHLYDLKAAVYDTPYQNEPTPFQMEGYTLLETQHIENRIFLPTQADIENLFQMTPYYYKTGKVEQERLQKLEMLSVQTDFYLLVYKKQ